MEFVVWYISHDIITGHVLQLNIVHIFHAGIGMATMLGDIYSSLHQPAIRLKKRRKAYLPFDIIKCQQADRPVSHATQQETCNLSIQPLELCRFNNWQ